MEKNKKSVTCEIRNCVGEECPLNTYNSNITELKLFKKCTDDITSHLKSLCIYSENVKKMCKCNWTVVNSKSLEANPLR